MLTVPRPDNVPRNVLWRVSKHRSRTQVKLAGVGATPAREQQSNKSYRAGQSYAHGLSLMRLWAEWIPKFHRLPRLLKGR